MTEINISVLVSVYKSEKATNLERALQSIYTDQTMKPEEIILIQDGPLGDELLSVISAWKKKLGDILVLIVNEQNKVERHDLQLGAQFDKYYLVKSGVNAGDKVIVSNLQKIREGQPVQAVEPQKGDQNAAQSQKQ